jgi:hypothetical protein
VSNHTEPCQSDATVGLLHWGATKNYASPQCHQHVIYTAKLIVTVISFTFFITLNAIIFISFIFMCLGGCTDPFSQLSVAVKPSTVS